MGKDKDHTSTNTSCYVQVLGVGSDTGCTVPSALLFFDRHRYLFNAGEGFQRFCVEHKVKLTKVNAVLATRVTTEATGGLPGMLLTMADTTAGGLLTGQTGMTVHGPPGLTTLVNGFRTFVNVKDMGLKVMEFKDARNQPILSNEAVSIHPIVIRPGTKGTGNDDQPASKRQKTIDQATATLDNPAPTITTNDSNDNNNTANEQQQSAIWNIPSAKVESAAACYVCELPDIPGKFLPQKAASLGVPRGPLYGQLAKGIEVKGANGRIVKPDDVMEASTPGPVVLVVDCPSQAFIEELVDREKGVGRWAVDDTVKDKVACIIHLTPKDVLHLPEYHKFIKAFPATVQHILVATAETSNIPVLRKSAILQIKLNALDSNLFSNPLEISSKAKAGSAIENFPPENTTIGRNMLRFFLRPLTKRGFNDEECSDILDTDTVVKELKEEKPLALENACKAKEAVIPEEGPEAPPPAVKRATGDEVAVTFLGTGAAIPSKYRNVTGILVDMPRRNAAMLLDCGEGSLGQLHLKLGDVETEKLLRRLSLVWISHIHADHHVGLPSLLAARTRLLGSKCAPLLVIGPRPLRRALGAYASLEPMNFRYIEAAMTESPSAIEERGPLPEDVSRALQAAKQSLGLSVLESFRVVHCAHSFGLVLKSDEGEDGWKIVFSGDTRPCDAVIHAAKDATLLIHEATFDDSMVEEAIAKKHCTTKEAVESGVKAGAYRTVLTHFSQRYPKVPVIDENFVNHVGIAFDLMTLRLIDLPRLPALVPAIKELFEEEEEEEGAGEDAEPVPKMLT